MTQQQQNMNRTKESITGQTILEKTTEYNEYKSNLIRLILLDHAHFSPNEKGKKLLFNIMQASSKYGPRKENNRGSGFIKSLFRRYS